MNPRSAGKDFRAAGVSAHEILMHLRNLKKSSREVSLYEPIGIDREGNEIALLEILGTDADAVSEQVENHLLFNWLKDYVDTLTDKERMVLTLRFGLAGGARMTQRDIAKKLGISRSYVSRIEKRAVNKILTTLSALPPALRATPPERRHHSG